MNIIKDDIFTNSLKQILKYISQDSKSRASKFNIQLSKKISNIPNMPLKFRQSSYYEDEKIRDLVFKGYTIPYLVDIDKNVIIILDIFKWSYKKQIK